MIKFTYRQEEKKDRHEVENVIREAFWNKFMPGCTEHYVVHTMRDSEKFIPELAFVALDEGKIVGGIYYVENELKTKNGQVIKVLEFGPLGVLPEYQGKGVASGLIGITKQIALMLGYKAIFITGDISFYKMFGFKKAQDFSIKYGDEFFEPFLACELTDNYLKNMGGSVVESEVYNVDRTKANIFNTSFPRKEKKVLEGQIFDEDGNFIG